MANGSLQKGRKTLKLKALQIFKAHLKADFDTYSNFVIVKNIAIKIKERHTHPCLLHKYFITFI